MMNNKAVSDGQGFTAATLLALGVVWAALCLFDLSTAAATGGYSLTNHRFLAALIALASAIASFVAFGHVRRSRQRSMSRSDPPS